MMLLACLELRGGSLSDYAFPSRIDHGRHIRHPAICAIGQRMGCWHRPSPESVRIALAPPDQGFHHLLDAALQTGRSFTKGARRILVGLKSRMSRLAVVSRADHERPRLYRGNAAEVGSVWVVELTVLLQVPAIWQTFRSRPHRAAGQLGAHFGRLYLSALFPKADSRGTSTTQEPVVLFPHLAVAPVLP